jgi:hypothetical protein
VSEFESRYDPPAFHGDSYAPEKHFARLSRQLDRVRMYLMANEWVTLKSTAEACGCSEPSASARIRDVRKEGKKNGLWSIERKEGEPGLFWYRLVLNTSGKEDSVTGTVV